MTRSESSHKLGKERNRLLYWGSHGISVPQRFAVTQETTHGPKNNENKEKQKQKSRQC